MGKKKREDKRKNAYLSYSRLNFLYTYYFWGVINANK